MSKVVVQECKNYDIGRIEEKISQGMEFLGGWNKFLHEGMTVLIKVNLIGPKTSDSAAVTHCGFVRALTRILKGKGCKVWIGDSSGGAYSRRGLCSRENTYKHRSPCTGYYCDEDDRLGGLRCSNI